MLGFDAVSQASLSGLPDSNPAFFGTAVGTATVLGVITGKFTTFGTAVGTATVLGVVEELFTEAVLAFMSNASVPSTGTMSNSAVSVIGTF